MPKENPPAQLHSPEIRPTWMAYGLFAVKLIFLIALIFLQVRHHDWLSGLGIPDQYLEALLFFLTAQLVVSFVRTTLAAIYRRRRKVSAQAKDTFILGINQIASIASFIVFILAALIIFNINIREALTAISIVAAAIAILSKDYVSNMINGMILMFSDQIRLHDVVKIGDHEGKIIDLSLMHVHLLNEDNNVIFIPNSLILTDGVINYTLKEKRLVAVEFGMAISQVESVEQVAAQLKPALSSFQAQIVPETVSVRATDLTKDSVQFRFQCQLKVAGEPELETRVRNAMIKAAVRLSSGHHFPQPS